MGVNLNYDEHFASKREDGRHLSTYAAYLARFRDINRTLDLPEDLTEESFSRWRSALIEKHRELLCMPEATEQPAPKLLSREMRDGYRLEKWEFYPDDYTAVPFLALIPNEASSENPVPKYGLTEEEFMEDYSRVDGYDHSFRAEHSLRLLKKAFGK